MKYAVVVFIAGMVAPKIAAGIAAGVSERVAPEKDEYMPDNADESGVYSGGYTREMNRYYAERDGTHKAKED
jgi:hypothetical protein